MSKKEVKPDPPGKLVNTQQTEAYREQLRVSIHFLIVLIEHELRKRNEFLLGKQKQILIDLITISKRVIITSLCTTKKDSHLKRPKLMH